MRNQETLSGSNGIGSASEVLLFTPNFREMEIIDRDLAPDYARHLVILCDVNHITKESIEARIAGVECLILQSQYHEMDQRFRTYAEQIFETVKHILEEKPGANIRIQLVVAAQHEQKLFTGLHGFLKTAHLENPRLIGQMIEVNPALPIDELVGVLSDSSRSKVVDRLRYYEGKNWAAGWSEIEPTRQRASVPWKDGGIYLITGGIGGLGLLFADDIARRVNNPVVILTGRSPLCKEKEAKLNRLRETGARLEYRQMDVTQKEQVENLIHNISEGFGGLNGIIHSAGVVCDGFILKKTREELQQVLSPKVSGLTYLDLASKDLSLDFFVFFSSIAGSLGNPGQADYAAANAFMDSYAGYRNALVASKQRQGRTLSINWPLWKEGGMKIDNVTEDLMKQNLGVTAMDTKAGIHAFYHGLASSHDQLLVISGDAVHLRADLLGTAPQQAAIDSQGFPTVDPVLLKEKTGDQLKSLFGQITQVNATKIDVQEPLESYGIDSLIINQLNNQLGHIFSELSKTLFYEYLTLGEVAEYLTLEFPEQCTRWTGLQEQPEIMPDHSLKRPHPDIDDEFPVLVSLKKREKRPSSFTSHVPDQQTREPIAIIGMSGRYPQAKNLSEYWENLKAGKDCISEIPDDRWLIDGFYDPDPEEAVSQGKSYSKWGSFLEGFADFDPLFFNISPREAMIMDPQERLFIQSCWEALEDAGYTREQLATQHNRRVGVFAGITKTGYDLYGPGLWEKGKHVNPYTSFSSVANRVSYFLNLKGPSMPIDTMCSSSLTAIHEACEHLHHGECEMAIAGGVNLYLHPSNYHWLSAQKMLSKDGKCKSFGQGANGFVPGEGVGIIILKPLSRAIADEDHIHAVIKSTSTNHGGKTNGYTVPSPVAQGDLIRTALEKAGVNARAVSYLEAHGTGTDLGDPIEISGLTQAFSADTRETGFCSIGSAKSNIGHLEAAAGMAGLTKIVLQMKHRMLVPSLHATELNPNIDFNKTPFIVQQKLEEWRKPVIYEDGRSNEYPRIAGVSSFGAGGSNAHVILEEYIAGDESRPQRIVSRENPAVVVLSAKNEARLQEKVEQLLEAIRKESLLDSSLADMAYTLQVGREAMEERIALVVESMDDLQEKLKSYLEGRDVIDGLYRGQAKSDQERMEAPEENQDIEAWIQHSQYGKMLELWVQGMRLDWSSLYGEVKPRRMSLPAYPFARDRYFIAEKGQKMGSTTASLDHTTIWNGQNHDASGQHLDERAEESDYEAMNIRAASGKGRRKEMRGLSVKQCLDWDLKNQIGKLLEISHDRLDIDVNLADFGFDSISLATLAAMLTKHFEIDLSPSVFFGHSTIDKMIQYYMKEHQKAIEEFYFEDTVRIPVKAVPRDQDNAGHRIRSRTSISTPQNVPEPIAIIGMSGRFPEARSIDEMWSILAEGRNAVKEIPADRFDWRQYYSETGKQPQKMDSKWCGCIPGVSEFDPLFFEISPKEAETMDPRQRLLLQEAWKALEHAGYGDKKIAAGKIGMFVGAEQGDYQLLAKGEGGITSNHNGILAARLSYFLNLSGPVLTVDTACSSGLAAAHQACLSLRNNECDTAIAAGVNLMLTPDAYIGMSQAGMLSKDGTCYAFDKRGNGLVPGEAVAVVVLKRLSLAEADGDPILGVIRGSSINYDGKTNGITAPSGVAQTELLKAVYEQAQVDPSDIEYIVTHGTGTKLGDPVEINALHDAFKEYTDKQGYCAVTSNKTNFGHTFASSGLVNLIGLIQAFRHETITASLNFEQENDFVQWQKSPFYVNTRNKPWPASSTQSRLGAVSAFGMSGTNVHMVLQSYSRRISEAPAVLPPYFLLTLSAKTKEALDEKIRDMVVMLQNENLPDEDLLHMSYTLLEGRQHFNHRVAFVVKDRQDAEYMLTQTGAREKLPNQFEGKVPRDFTGQSMIQQYVHDLIRQISTLKEDHNHYREALSALADFYCQGYEINGNVFLSGSSPRLISLPTYPFARERYWVSAKELNQNASEGRTLSLRIKNRPSKGIHVADKMKSVSNHVSDNNKQETYELMTFEEVWEVQPLADTSIVEMKTVVCFLSQLENKQKVLDVVHTFKEDTQVIFISRDTCYAKNSPQDYNVSGTDVISYEKALLSIREDNKEVDAVLYLWAIEDSEYVRDYSNIVQMVKAIAAAKLKPKHLLLAGLYENALERCYLESWIGFERSLGLVLPNMRVSTVSLESEGPKQIGDMKDLIRKLWAELGSRQEQSVLYQGGKRHVCRIKPTKFEPSGNAFRQGGTYLVTGGCGGLGLLFARHLASKQPVNLILTGRSPLNEDKQSMIQELERMGSNVLYVKADICDANGMREGLFMARERFGPINGVIHAAGMSSSQTILDKEMDEFHEVLAPKIEGTLVLDELLREDKLDFICYFSSTSAVLGDFGSCDYAIGNRFEMAYARHRNEQGKSGSSIVINWPLWKDGGMGFHDEDNTALYLKSSGQRLLEAAEGLTAFDSILSQNFTQHLLLVGQRSRVHRFLGIASGETSHNIAADVNENTTRGKGWRSEMKGLSLDQCLEWDLKEMVSHLLKIPRDKLDLEENLGEFGFDSINLAQFATLLTEHYEVDITPSLFFGQSTIGKLIMYFLEDHLERVKGFYREGSNLQAVPQHSSEASEPEYKAYKRARVSSKESRNNIHEPIAIIGMSGRFPEARNIDEMWSILAAGKTAVKEIPSERFDWRHYYREKDQENGHVNCKWCGSVPGVREFDPMFFEISPKEAEMMDPRQRLLLQESWRALEDAGYGEEKLRTGNIGMFVGVEDGDYHLLVKDKGNITSNHNAILAARLSYFLNLTGPNMAINTACSSGLVAAHQACMSLRNGECDTAIAAGVNLLLTPNAYGGISQAGILSEEGICYAFDKRANGTVPGEAVAVVVLKRLSQAIADKDPIYGVIRGSGINYDGKTNGITAPSGVAQTKLLKDIYNQYQINPEEIEYIVTHGTGTKLGDPVEINALYDAFKEYTHKQGYCALTSSKTNFGHTFAASGLVSLINLVLSMRHGIIPPSLNCEEESDYIHWNESPFYVNKKSKEWNRADGKALKGAISAFGMSGTNAHMVIESYSREDTEVAQERPPYYLLALSAKTSEALEDKIRDLADVLQNKDLNDEELLHISYTLLQGRHHFNHRCAVVIQDSKDAIYVLKQAGVSQKVPNLFEGRVPRDFTGQKAMKQYAHELLMKSRTLHNMKSQYQETLFALADLYCQGYAIDWDLLFGDDRPYRVKLPAYPFAKEHYWVKAAEQASDVQKHLWMEEMGLCPVNDQELIINHVNDVEIELNEVNLPITSVMDADILLSASSEQLRKTLVEVTGIPENKLDDEASFEELGLDSLMINALNKKIEQWVGKLDATLFYKYNNIKDLGAYLAQEYEVAVSALVEEATPAQRIKSKKQAVPAKGATVPIRSAASSAKTTASSDHHSDTPADIAIIGVAGRYPKAETLEQFWDNLVEGRDCIEEIPVNRWPLQGFYEPDRTKAVAKGLSYSKWGGFLDRIEYFDPLFFNISPRDAMYMDPQERLFLEVAWGCMENAGYTRESLKRDGYGNQIGVFVGATFNNYQLFMADAAKKSKQDLYIATSQMFSVANRVSYIMNFTGPSLTVDTACSSSLYAVHLACESIRNGQSRMAIAGGVNLSLHPSKYVTLCQGQFNASDGRCRAFSEGGTGYVPAEAVGAVFLKPLQDAIKDHDSIYGVIKGTAVSHAGKTNGYTVPSPVSQSQAIEKALIQSRIHPRSISSIEAHGTGTALGDPIEIKGLTDVFSKYTEETAYCSISSVKSNIGHAEAAAGIAQLTKVLLQLKHQTLVKNVMHGKGLNPNIDFDQTPFIVQANTSYWERPTVNGQEVPRRSGISSFGAGGANAHIVIEEYIPSSQRLHIPVNAQNQALILLSAKNQDRLLVQAKQLLSSIHEQQLQDEDLADMAFTLQIGREAMEERLALTVGSIAELGDKLERFINDRDLSKDLYRGQVKRNKEMMSVFEVDEEIQEAIVKWIERKKYAKLLNLWVKGLHVDWNLLYSEVKPSRISLPTYPFIGEPYWVPEVEEASDASKISEVSEAAAVFAVHPLLHRNTSDLSGIRFSSVFTGQEFFLTDHVVKGQRVLPGVAYLEMARVAVEQVTAGVSKEKGRTKIRLKNVVWARPIAVGDDPVQVHIELFTEDNGEIAYEVYTGHQNGDTEPVLHSQGSAMLSTFEQNPVLDIKALQADCSQGVITSEQIYETYNTMGIHYGPGHQGIQKVIVGDGQVLAKLSLPPGMSGTSSQFILHPSLMDSALQATISLMLNTNQKGSSSMKAGLPFALQELEVLGSCPSEIWAVIRYSAGNKADSKVQRLDIDLCDDHGMVYVKVKGFSTRILDGEAGPSGVDETPGTLMLEPVWKEQPVPLEAEVRDYAEHLVFLCETDKVLTEKIINSQMRQARYIALECREETVSERFLMYTGRIFTEIQSILQKKPKDKILIQIVIPAQQEQLLFAGLSGLLKAAQSENSKLMGQIIEIEANTPEVTAKLMECGNYPLVHHIRYREGKRWVAGWGEIEGSHMEGEIPWKDNGIYLITGGAGGLGMIFAREMIDKVKGATLILTGRSPLGEVKNTELDGLRALDAKVVYKQIDVTDKLQVSGLIQSIREEYGSLNGIVHAAGIIRDNLILKKDVEELREVMAPKVAGLVNLDEASEELPLDFLIAFSSVAAANGNPGQADYSAANAFMDAYAGYRNALTASNQRHGRMLSINWPLWREGGMRVDEEVEKIMLKSLGTVPLQTSTGIQALYEGWGSGKNQVVLMTGILSRVRPRMIPAAVQTPPLSKTPAAAVMDDGSLLEKVQSALMETVSNLLKVKLGDIDVHSELSEYGFDSISLTQFANMLNEEYNLELTPTLFFEYTTIHSFSVFLMTEHHGAFAVEAPATNRLDIPAGKAMEPEQEERIELSSLKKSRSRPEIQSAQIASSQQGEASEPIAIVGVSGLFPMARDVNEFWNNIVEGKDCITEIPKERWDWKESSDDPAVSQGKTSLKWGGFIEGVKEFDPLFFGISPREAEIMDPQQRLLLTQVWKAIEDAGIAPHKLSQNTTGVFVAAGPGDYMNITSVTQGNPQAMTGVVPSLIPNRISYALNLHGPSEYYETACSSTLVALHRAIRSIYNRECEQAIVGAVNLLISPVGFIGFDAMGYLSPEGQAKSFQSEANGFVRSEGVGAVIIKPLTKAIEDNDLIYAVIKGTGVAHGGKGMSLTSPNAAGMKAAMLQSFKGSAVDPRTISYIEAHGIASPMADGIEINALKSGYQDIAESTHPDLKQVSPCYISTLKPVIGHGEVASGMAALIKAILAIRHKLIPGVLRFTTPSEHISLAGSPLRITAEHHEWNALTDAEGRKLPRRAAINSYGIGGVNAHVILEEYIPVREESPYEAPTSEPQIVVLSAKKPERLKESAWNMIEFVEKEKEFSITEFAYTLQVGRDQMDSRLAFVVSSREELIYGLKQFLDVLEGEERVQGPISIYTGNTGISSSKLEDEFMEALFAEHNLEKIALYWTKGGKFPWESLHEGKKVHRMSLPTYPFEKRICWPDHHDPSEIQIRQVERLIKISSLTETAPAMAVATSSSKYVTDIVSRILGLEPAEINPNLPLDQYGLDSILFMQLLQQLQNQVDPELELIKLQNCKTLQEIIDNVQPQREDKQVLPIQHTKTLVPVSWPQFPELILLNKGLRGSPVFWFHGGLGGVEMYQQLAQTSQRPFYGIQARGWMTDRSPLQGVGAMAAYYAHIIQSVQPDGPYDLGGYSLGGVLAYEVVRQLQELGKTVNTVVMLDSPFGREFQQGEITRETAVLQAVNLALASKNFQEPEKFAQTLIHRNELNMNVNEEKLLQQLIELGNMRGLTKTENQIRSMIEANIKMQHAYQFDRFSVMPLPDAKAVTCYYFRNRRGLIFGELEPYFSTTEDSSALDHAAYWEEWERQFTNLHVIDIDPSNHMVLLSEPKSYETIFEFCEELYSEPGITTTFLQEFIKKAKNIHGSKI